MAFLPGAARYHIPRLIHEEPSRTMERRTDPVRPSGPSGSWSALHTRWTIEPDTMDVSTSTVPIMSVFFCRPIGLS